MNPWIFIGLVGAGIVFCLDYLVRRKKWKENTKAEKISLLVHMLSISIYAFTSVLGLFLESLLNIWQHATTRFLISRGIISRGSL